MRWFNYIFWALVVLLVIFLLFLLFANIKTRNEYIKIYNECLEQKPNSYLIDESIRKDCSDNGGCLLPCGGCGTLTKPSVSIKDVFNNLGKLNICADVCKPVCLLPY
jgi:hypothetical protein